MMTVSPFSADAAPTRYLQVGALRLAYRVIGPDGASPLVLAMRFRGVMDDWDPAFIDALASQRRVYWFDSASIGLSSGEVPDSIPGMARVLIDFIEALGLKQVGLFFIRTRATAFCSSITPGSPATGISFSTPHDGSTSRRTTIMNSITDLMATTQRAEVPVHAFTAPDPAMIGNGAAQ